MTRAAQLWIAMHPNWDVTTELSPLMPAMTNRPNNENALHTISLADVIGNTCRVGQLGDLEKLLNGYCMIRPESTWVADCVRLIAKGWAQSAAVKECAHHKTQGALSKAIRSSLIPVAEFVAARDMLDMESIRTRLTDAGIPAKYLSTLNAWLITPSETACALRLGVTQPAVSRRLAAMLAACPDLRPVIDVKFQIARPHPEGARKASADRINAKRGKRTGVSGSRIGNAKIRRASAGTT